MPTVVLFSPSPVKRVAEAPRQPRLSVAWESRARSFRTSLSAYITGPKPLKTKWAGPYFRDSRIEMRLPTRALMASFVWHIAVLCIIPLPFWARLLPQAQPQSPLARVELTWYEPERDLPSLTLPAASSESSPEPSPPGEPAKPLPRRGAEAYHPRQTILSLPARVTHPRQTLIRPNAPLEAPKILPQLPNIVQWADSAPSNPRLAIRPSASAPTQRKRANQEAVVPEPLDSRRNPGQVNFAGNAAAGSQPKLPVASSAPVLRRQAAEESPAPEPLNLEKTPGQMNFGSGPVVNSQPRLPVTPSAPAPHKRTEGTPAVEAPNLQPNPGQVNFVTNPASEPQPKLPLAPSASAPGPRGKAAQDAGPAPEIAARASADTKTERFIALSATPAPVPPPAKPPQGNLSARVMVSPEGTQPGVPSGSANELTYPPGGAGAASKREAIGGTGAASSSHTGASQAGAGGGKGAAGPVGVTISPGSGPVTPTLGPSGTNVSHMPGTLASAASPHASTLPSGAVASHVLPPAPNTQPSSPQPEPVDSARTPTMGMENIEAAATPEQILGDKQVYTLYVNMPNLTSTTGSWILNFAALQPQENPANGGGLAGPVPIRKVDPKYPPTLVAGHIEGEVILYAIIRRDGSVDSIQLLKGVDPQLDQNAMEALAHWKFRPALRNRTPVELEAVVHIPFRSTPPL